METWGRILALSVGGVAGVNARYWLGVWINRWASSQFPWATFSINVSGSLAIGFLTALLARWSPHSHLRLVILVGFLGGYTTFSTYAFESVTLWQRGEWGFSLTNMAGSVAGRLRRGGARRRAGAGNRPAHLELAAGRATINDVGVECPEARQGAAGGRSPCDGAGSSSGGGDRPW